MTVTNGSFVGEDVVSMTATGTVTEPGKVTNTIVITFADGKSGNYEVTKDEGELEVVTNTKTIVIEAASASKPYDGTPLTDDGYSYTEGVLPEGYELTAVVEGSATNVGDPGGRSRRESSCQLPGH